MKTKKLLGVLFLVIALVITQLPVPTVNAINTTSDFQMQGTKLVKYLGTSSSVIIPEGVKTIGAEAFSDCDFIEEFSIPKSVLSIEDMAFSGCASVSVITLPETTEALGTFAFYNCENLKTLYFGDSLKSLGDGVVLGCNNLEKVIISDNNMNFVRDNGFVYSTNKTKLWFLCPGSEKTTYTMPSTINEIAKYAFWGCDNLEEVYFSTSMEKIPAYAFMNSKKLKKINFPFNITSIDMKAFAYCIGLTEVEIPISVKYIHPTAFDSCKNIVLNPNSGEYAVTFFEENKERFNPTSFYLEEDGFEEISTEEPSEIVDHTIDNSEILGSTHIVGGNAMVIVKNTDNIVFTGYNNVAEKIFGVEWENEFIKENSIIKAAFYGKELLTGITIPENVVRINDFSFARTGLKQINIPKNVTEIGYAAFYHCDELKEVKISNMVTHIAGYAFDKTPWMEEFFNQKENKFLIVGDGILIAYNGEEVNLVIPDEVKNIAAYAFNNHNEISKISGGVNLQYVDENAFYGCNVNITKKDESLEINNSINSSYAVVLTEQLRTKNKFIVSKWVLVFFLLVFGIVFLSIKDKKRKEIKLNI